MKLFSGQISWFFSAQWIFAVFLERVVSHDQGKHYPYMNSPGLANTVFPLPSQKRIKMSLGGWGEIR